jgi:acetyl esterase/lipase
MWAGSDDPARLAAPRVSPGLGDLEGLPPTLMLCGARDLLQPGCDALFDRAEEADWPMEYVVVPGLIHVYPLLPIPEAAEAMEQVVEFCRRG